MIIEQKSEVMDNTSLQTIEFDIKNSPLLYKILFSSLYEDKEKIVLQELAANGLDAHIAAGNTDTPIRIYLPTPLSPELVVEDMGTGMSLETLTGIYPIYMESTKRLSNSQIGGFGLGSKSPFALSKTFIVETTHKGITSTASAFLDNGTPKFTIFTSGNIGRKDGTIIRVPVTDLTSQQRLATSAKKLFCLWEVQPVFFNVEVSNLTYMPVEVTDTYYMFEGEAICSQSSFDMNVAVGPFVYKIPAGLRDKLKANDEEFDKILNILRFNSCNNTIVIPKFPIGTLELSPSRERIEDTEDNFIKVREGLLTLIKNVLEQSVNCLNFNSYLAVVKEIRTHGVFINTYNKSNGIFIGIDPAKLDPIMEKLFGGKTTLLAKYYVMHYVWKRNDILDSLSDDEILELADDTLLEDFEHRVYSYRRSTKTARLLNRPLYTLDIDIILREGLNGAAGKIFSYMLYPETLYKIEENGYARCSISSVYRTNIGDVRDSTVFVGDISDRRKVYNWFRTLASEDTPVLVMTPKMYKDVVACLELKGIINDNPKGRVATDDDVNLAWSNKAKPTREYVSKATKAPTVKVTDSTVLGTAYSYNIEGKSFTLEDLNNINKDDTHTVIITSKIKDDYIRASSGSIKTYDIPVIPDIGQAVIILDIPKSVLRRKVVVEAIEALKLRVKVQEEANFTQFTFKRAIQELPIVVEAVKVGDYNRTLLLYCSNLYRDYTRASLIALTPLFASLKGSKESIISNSHIAVSGEDKRNFITSLPELTRLKLLGLSYTSSSDPIYNVTLSRADLNAIKDAYSKITNTGDSVSENSIY